ncbi:phospholipid carrier-dependent glycosyltransferase [Novosphingobium sp.]|uniref:phospholipid carrier-dependent glycosyltransferase n=1 Tax=Novosphingobium sp. TaxID=1874826 RepID=UPI00262D9CC4|nr:phospholipid carrier-dependent glycosyltransferase [Novosphingobium sp.]
MADGQGPTTTCARRPWLATLAIAAIFTVGLVLRIHGVSFGLPALNDPDELIFELGSLRMLRTLSLNPGWFGHPGTTTMEILAAANLGVLGFGRAMGWFADSKDFANAVYANPAWIILPGRLAMVAFGAGTVWQTFRLGEELAEDKDEAAFARLAALAAAALVAIEPASMTWSQVIRTDIMATFFMLLSLRAALRAMRQERLKDHIVAGLWLGLAIATKWPTGIAAIALGGAAAMRLITGTSRPRQIGLHLAAGAAATVAGLLAVSPYIALDFNTVVHNLQGEAQTHHLGATGGSPLHNLGWYATGPILTGLGFVGCALAVIGVAWLLRHRAGAVLLPLIAAFIATICSQALVWERWILPMVPLLALAMGLGWAQIMDRLSRACGQQQRLLTRSAGFALLGAALIQPAMASWSRKVERQHDARQLATAWAAAHIPAGSTVLVEHFAFEILPRPWHLIFPFGDVGCVDVRAYLGGKVQYDTINAGRGGRSNVDYGTVTPDKRGSCRADYAILTQYDRYAAERGTFPQEYAAYRDLVAQGKIVATFARVPGRIGGLTTHVVSFGARAAAEGEQQGDQASAPRRIR